jgi:hypothetical protein
MGAEGLICVRLVLLYARRRVLSSQRLAQSSEQQRRSVVAALINRTVGRVEEKQRLTLIHVVSAT